MAKVKSLELIRDVKFLPKIISHCISLLDVRIFVLLNLNLNCKSISQS